MSETRPAPANDSRVTLRLRRKEILSNAVEARGGDGAAGEGLDARSDREGARPLAPLVALEGAGGVRPAEAQPRSRFRQRLAGLSAPFGKGEV